MNPMPNPVARSSQKPIIGWREWISLPDLGVKKIKVKVDSGARTSTLHAHDVEFFKSGSTHKVRFRVFPKQRDHQHSVISEAPLVDKRWIKSSVGHQTLRPVIHTFAVLGPHRFPLELTLVNRDVMGFRMLLGRQAFRSRFLVDGGRSFVFRKKKKKLRKLA